MATPDLPDVATPGASIRDDALASPTSPYALLRQLGLRARKSYSQSFLTDVRLTEQIASAAELVSTDQVLEVGPGLGILTQALARRAARIVAVELDRQLAAALPRLVPANVEVVHGDALTINVAAYFAEPYKVVANLPYQITSPFMFRFLKLEPRPTLLVLMIQREVAERIAARVGQLSYLAVAVQSTARVRIVRLVPPGAFFPRPKIESAVIRLDPLAEPLVPFEQREAFLGVVRAGVTQPRKTLLNSLAQGLGQSAGWERIAVRALLDAAGIAPERRPQELSLPEWRVLFEAHTQLKAAAID
jgi:16S rRNA (adenine1518-N6/adenine1519-N6)-dimethyltransferase